MGLCPNMNSNLEYNGINLDFVGIVYGKVVTEKQTI